MNDRTGTAAEKREYVEKQMRVVVQKVFGLEARLEKLGKISPERRDDIDGIASYLDGAVGRIESVLARWDEGGR